MQIFFVDEDPYKAAQALHDIHVRKQIVETAQILSTNLRLMFDGEIVDELYKSYNPNHPVTKWARESYNNFMWTYYHFRALLEEYSYRTGKIHKSYEKYSILKWLIHNKINKDIFPKKEITPLLAVKDAACIISNDPVETYRNYYRKHKLFFETWGEAKWSKR